MKKLFFTLLTLCLAMPFSAWADEHNSDHNSGQIGDGSSEEVFDGEQDDDYGSIIPSDIQLSYKIVSQPSGEYGASDYVAGTVYLEGVYSVPTGITSYSVSIPHEIQVVNINMSTLTADVALYTVVGIDQNAFTNNTYLTAVTIPTTVTYIGSPDAYSGGAFSGCTKLETVSFVSPSSVEKIGLNAFNGCSALASIDIPESVTSLGANCFQNCSSITEVVLHEGITMIPSTCFYGCYNLTTVWMSGSVSIYTNAFAECGSLSAFVLEGSEPATTGGSESGNPFLDDASDVITLYVPTGSAPAYLKTQWATDMKNDEETLQWNFNEIEISANAYSASDEKYYATYYTDADGEFYTDIDPCIVYEVVENGEVDYKSIAEAGTYAKIPAATALLIASENSGTTYYYHPYEFASTTYASTDGNLLYGSTTATTTSVNGVTEGYYFYKLSRNAAGDAGSVGFYWDNDTGAAFSIPAYKAWLAIAITEKTSGISGYTFGKGEATGITAVEAATETAKKGIYTISGVRVNDMSKAGLYIVDGKKVIVK